MSIPILSMLLNKSLRKLAGPIQINITVIYFENTYALSFYAQYILIV